MCTVDVFDLIVLYQQIMYTMCMRKQQLIHARTCVYNVNYHLVWSVKYRHPLLTAGIESRLKEICNEIAEDKEFIIHKLEVGERDHVHAFVSAHPKVSPSYIAKMLKGISARKLFVEYPELKKKCWKGRLWNGSYYLETIGSTSEENIKKYIDRQKKGE